jgi:hypothetical protein
MARSIVIRSGEDQIIKLPDEVAFPDDVREVVITRLASLRTLRG